MITGPEAGITRDSITLDWEWQGRPVRLVDTAGLRKRAKVEDKLEKLSAADTRRAIDLAEVVVLLLDATRGLEAQDLQIADQVLEEGRALIIALNKWDVAEHASSLFNGVKAALEEGLVAAEGRAGARPSRRRPARASTSCSKAAFEVREAWSRRVTTGELNRWFEDAVEANPPPAPGGKRIKLRYITQVKTRPPSFVVFGTRVDQLPGQLSPLSAQFDAARPRSSARCRCACPSARRKIRSTARRAKANFTLCAVVPIRNRAPTGARSKMSDDELDIVDWVHFERSRAELGAGLHPHPQLFPRGWSEVGRADRSRRCTTRIRPRWSFPAHTHEGRSAPVRRRAARGDRRADREYGPPLHRNAAASPTSWCPRSSSCGGCSTGRSSCSTRRPTRC